MPDNDTTVASPEVEDEPSCSDCYDDGCSACWECEACGHCAECDYFHDGMEWEYGSEGCSSCVEIHQDWCGDCQCSLCGNDCGGCGDCDPDSEGDISYVRVRVSSPTHGDPLSAEYLNRRRTVGIELELENGSTSGYQKLVAALPPNFGVGSDGSIDYFPSGVEMRTPPGYGREFEQQVVQMVEGAREGGYAPTSRTGLHVHVDMNDFLTEEGTWQLYATVAAAQKALYLLQPGRRNSSWCNPLAGVARFQEDYTSYGRYLRTQQMRWAGEPRVTRILAALRDHKKGAYIERRAIPGKYHIANIGTDYGTVEFRLFAATVDTDVLLGWAGLCQSLVDWVGQDFDDNAVLSIDNATTQSPLMGLRTLMNVVQPTPKSRKAMLKLAAKGAA